MPTLERINMSMITDSPSQVETGELVPAPAPSADNAGAFADAGNNAKLAQEEFADIKVRLGEKAAQALYRGPDPSPGRALLVICDEHHELMPSTGREMMFRPGEPPPSGKLRDQLSEKWKSQGEELRREGSRNVENDYWAYYDGQFYKFMLWIVLDISYDLVCPACVQPDDVLSVASS
jgi:hypothetical protein